MAELEVGKVAQELFVGYLAYTASAYALDQPEIADATVAALEAANRGPAAVPTATIVRADGSVMPYHLTHAIRTVRSTSSFRLTYDRLWLAGALLTLGDRLSEERYFDQGPDLEFVRHLRNGIAHGNKFHFVRDEPRRPAHFTGPDGRVLPDATTTGPGYVVTFEITRALEGRRVLFDFIGPGDIFDLLTHVSLRLMQMGNEKAPS